MFIEAMDWFPGPCSGQFGGANRIALPSQFLHVDTTFFTLPDGSKMATVFVSDNFSRHILGFHTSTQHGFENVKAALQVAFLTIKEYFPDLKEASMVVDGGGENNALEMEGFLLASAPPAFKKLIAQKNIAFSNSPVEAINKIFKRYLRHWEPQNIGAFTSFVLQDRANARLLCHRLFRGRIRRSLFPII